MVFQQLRPVDCLLIVEGGMDSLRQTKVTSLNMPTLLKGWAYVLPQRRRRERYVASLVLVHKYARGSAIATTCTGPRYVIRCRSVGRRSS